MEYNVIPSSKKVNSNKKSKLIGIVTGVMFSALILPFAGCEVYRRRPTYNPRPIPRRGPVYNPNRTPNRLPDIIITPRRNPTPPRQPYGKSPHSLRKPNSSGGRNNSRIFQNRSYSNPGKHPSRRISPGRSSSSRRNR